MNKEIQEIADVLDLALLNRIGELDNSCGFGQYYAKVLYKAGYRKIGEITAENESDYKLVETETKDDKNGKICRENEQNEAEL